MAIPAPRIVIEAVRQDETQRRILRRVRVLRAHDVAMAKDLAQVDASYHYAYLACSGIEQYGERLGFSGREARAFARAGRAFGQSAELEARVLDCRISLDAAAALEPILSRPSLVREGEDWLLWAERWTCRRLEKEVRKRLRETEDHEPVSGMTILLTDSERDLFDRARVVACRKTGNVLDAGQTVGVLAEHYLESFDEALREPRKRRVASTETVPGRYVPAEVKRLVANRQKGKCCVPGCDNEIFLEYAHLACTIHDPAVLVGPDRPALRRSSSQTLRVSFLLASRS